MTPRTEPFSRWVVASVILHAALFGAAAFGGILFPSNNLPWGDEKGGKGIRVKVDDGRSLPGLLLPTPTEVNPGASPSESPGYQPPETAKSNKPEPPAPKSAENAPKNAKPPSTKEAIAIPDPAATVKPPKPAPQTASTPSPAPAPANVVTSGAGGTPSMMYGVRSSGAGTTSVGFSEGASGVHFGEYADRLTKAVSQYWQPAPGATYAPRVSIMFTINKDGTVSNVEFEKKSNNDALDNSAQRAILQAAARKLIPPLPPEFRGSSITARLTFEYRVR
jgi:TonB family protein